MAVTLSTPKPEIIEKRPGAEPLPGYRLIAPLGRGGFGEVWKCEAPGGLQKAIKFVSADGERFRQELSAFEQIRAIRHPFILGLDRVELTGGELVMVMELADCQLNDRYRICRGEGRPGIPREELIGYLREAAESLDMIGTRYGLQHLDVKPENLFLVAGHAKIGDYGLVRRAQRARASEDDQRGFTPRYTAPEVLMGRVDMRSDQYSLALVFVELLTGGFPFPGKTAQQLVVQHVSLPPDLSLLPEADRPAVLRALAKETLDRFPSCSAFIQALSGVSSGSAVISPLSAERPLSQAIPRVENDPTIVVNGRAIPGSFPPPRSESDCATPMPLRAGDSTEVNRSPNLFRAARQTQSRLSMRRPEPAPVDPFAGLLPVMPVSILQGITPRNTEIPTPSSDEFVDHVVDVAREGITQSLREQTNPFQVRFLSTFPFPMLPLKLALVAERFRLTIQPLTGNQMVLWRPVKNNVKRFGKSELAAVALQQKSGLEIVIHSPASSSAEYVAAAELKGMPDDDFARAAHEELPIILDQIRTQLNNLAERRAHPRYPTDFPVRVYPLYPDGEIGLPIGGRCRDISLGGMRLLTTTPIRTERLYVEFHEIEHVRNSAVYVRVVRTSQDVESQGAITGGRFRLREC